jgi:hypothetical protein
MIEYGTPSTTERVLTYYDNLINWSKYKIQSSPLPNGNGISQKGTVGIKLKASDMPFSKNGLSPDLIMNPNAIPSRMTLGQFVEALTSKVAALEGHTTDGTPFNEIDVDEQKERLKKLGFDEGGYEYLYNGMTGRKMKTKIFITPTYYERLKHMVKDKIHCLTMDHEVLTDNGWKFFNEINEYDLVATLDNGFLRYHKPNKLLHFSNYEGIIYNVSNNNVDLRVTDNHRMYVSLPINGINTNYEMIEAKHIYHDTVRYKTNADNDRSDSDVSINIIKLMAFLFNRSYKITDISKFKIVIPIKSQRLLLNKIITKLGYKLDMQRHTITVNNNDFIKTVYDYKNMFNSRLPQWVWELSKNQCRLLIRYMTASCEYKTTPNVFKTKSVNLADDFMILCLHAGWSSRRTNKDDIWNLYIEKDNNEPLVNDKTRDDTMENYKGNVFCLEMPTEIFYVRRNGIPVWTCNSRARGPRTLLTRQAPIYLGIRV